MANLLVYTDQPILGAGLQSLLAGDAGIRMGACCTDILTLKQHISNAAPDLVLLDVTSQLTPITLRELQKSIPETKFILWTTSIAAEFAMQALTIGVRGVLRKTLSLDAHIQCLRRVAAGGLWFEKSLMDSFRTPYRVTLSPRESQLVTLLSRGLKNKEISYELGLSEGTVKVYLSHLFQKSGARDRYDLALHGLQNMSAAGVPLEGHEGLRSLVMEPSCRA